MYRDASFHTSRVSISRETTCSAWRIRYSSSSYSRAVRSSNPPARMAECRTTSSWRSSTSRTAARFRIRPPRERPHARALQLREREWFGQVVIRARNQVRARDLQWCPSKLTEEFGVRCPRRRRFPIISMLSLPGNMMSKINKSNGDVWARKNPSSSRHRNNADEVTFGLQCLLYGARTLRFVFHHKDTHEFQCKRFLSYIPVRKFVAERILVAAGLEGQWRAQGTRPSHIRRRKNRPVWFHFRPSESYSFVRKESEQLKQQGGFFQGD